MKEKRADCTQRAFLLPCDYYEAPPRMSISSAAAFFYQIRSETDLSEKR